MGSWAKRCILYFGVIFASVNGLATEVSIMVTARAQKSVISSQQNFDISKHCMDDINKSMRVLEKYLGAHADKSSKKSKQSFESYLRQIKSVQPSCASEVFEMVSIFSAQQVYWGQTSEATFPLMDLLSYIQRRHLIAPLTPSVAKAFPELNDRDPLGIYSCENGKIWLDPNLRPYNLGTILLHELEHWLRNLALTSLKETSEFPQNLFTPASYLLFDESMSSLNEGIKQVQLRSNLNRDNAGQVYKKRWPLEITWDLLIRDSHKKNVFKARNDLNRYSPKGNLISLWEEQIRTQGVALEASYVDILKQHFFISGDANEKTESIFHLIQNIYSPSIPFLGFDVFSIANSIINNPDESLLPLVDPFTWVRNLDETQIDDLHQRRVCKLNEPGNGGIEGVGLLLNDDELKLVQPGLRACLKTIEAL